MAHLKDESLEKYPFFERLISKLGAFPIHLVSTEGNSVHRLAYSGSPTGKRTSDYPIAILLVIILGILAQNRINATFLLPLALKFPETH